MNIQNIHDEALGNQTLYALRSAAFNFARIVEHYSKQQITPEALHMHARTLRILAKATVALEVSKQVMTQTVLPLAAQYEINTPALEKAQLLALRAQPYESLLDEVITKPIPDDLMPAPDAKPARPIIHLKQVLDKNFDATLAKKHAKSAAILLEKEGDSE